MWEIPDRPYFVTYKALAPDTGPKVRPGRRLWLTRDGRLVEDGDPEAYSLYCTATGEVPTAEYNRLTDGGNEHAEAES